MSETALTATRRELRPGLIARFAGAFCDADFSRAIALSSMLLGAVSGLVIGLWSFGGPLPEPARIGGYSELPRRLVRRWPCPGRPSVPSCPRGRPVSPWPP